MAKTEPTKKPRVSVLERRLQNPFGQPSRQILLKDPSLIPRWFNSAVIADKIWIAKEQGWTPVKADDLAEADQIAQFKIGVNGYVCRGEREQEVLMCMPKDDYWKIQRAKSNVNIERMKRPGATKAEVADAAGRKLGDQAGSALNANMRVVGDVVDQYERVERLAVEE
jgi:hypothetical protein